MTRKLPSSLKSLQPLIPLLAVAVGSIACFVGFAQARYPQSNQDKIRNPASQSTSAQGTQGFSDPDLHLVPVQGNVFMLVGAGANITIQIGDDGVLLVDTGLAQMSDRVIAAIHSLSTRPIRYIIDTSSDADHTGGNEAIGKIGSTINAPQGAAAEVTLADLEMKGAAIVSFQAVLDRMQNSAPKDAWPVDTYTSDRKNLFFNGDRVQIYHQPAAHTDGDSIVFFRHADVVSTGDIFTTTRYPVIDLKRGGSVQGVIDGLNLLIFQITGAGDKEEGGTLVIPGHGRLCDQSDIVYYQEMVTIIRDRIQFLIGKGMTLEQIEQSRPTRDYDPRYGADSGPWTTDMFVEAVYKSLTQAKQTQEKDKPQKQ